MVCKVKAHTLKIGDTLVRTVGTSGTCTVEAIQSNPYDESLEVQLSDGTLFMCLENDNVRVEY